MPWPIAAQQILIIQFRQLGDVLLTTPAVKVLRDQYPHSRISYLTETGPAELLQGNPHIDNLIIRNRANGWFDDVRLAYSLRKTHYDLLIDFFCNPRSAWMSFLTGARQRVASYHAGRSWWYTYTPKIEARREYAPQTKLALLRAIGIEGQLVPPILTVPDEARQQIASFLREQQIAEQTPVITIDMTSRRQAKRWLPERYVQLADRLTERYQAAVIFTWGPGEQDQVTAMVRQGRHRHIVSCPITLLRLAALLERSRLHIGNCSAPRHIAAAVGTPTLIIMGPGDPVSWTYPSPLHQVVQGKVACLGCGRNECDTHECMRQLTVDEVEQAVIQYFDQRLKGKG